MKTRLPLILTAGLNESNLEPFDRLRREHFPPERNFLRAHLTMFHRLPGEHLERVVEILEQKAKRQARIQAEVNGLQHLGAGVAFVIVSPELQQVHAKLKSDFSAWLGGQDMQKWRPHITIQNKVSRPIAGALYKELSHGYEPTDVTVEGMDLWRYRGGPWQLEKHIDFGMHSD